MNFSPTQDQLDLKEGAKDFLRATCTPEILRELRDREIKNPDMWAGIAELGLLGFLASEQNGGLGMNAVGFSMLAEEAGYVALPEPFCDVAGIALPILNALGMSNACEQIASGAERVLTSHSLNPYLNQVQENDQLLLFSDDSIRLVDAGGYSLISKDSIDPLREISSVETRTGQLLSSGDQAIALEELARSHGAVFTASELIGLSNAMLDMATAYAKDRQQFGKPIGSYQAVKHHLASALVAIEFARPVVFRAAEAIATCNPHVSRFASHAKVAAIDAATQAVEVAIQVHGGMGYTFEVDLHLWMKRAWALQGLWGDRNHHVRHLEACLFQEKIQTGPAASFG